MSVFLGKGPIKIVHFYQLPAPSFMHSASPLFTLALALAQIICKNLSYFPRIVERGINVNVHVHIQIQVHRNV